MKPQTRPVKSGEGFPFFKVKIGDRIIGFRVPEIVQAHELSGYWAGIVQAHEQWRKHATTLVADAIKGEDAEGLAEASEDATRRHGELYGALGFVVLSCWNDEQLELESQTVWKSSFQIREALRHGLPLDKFDPLHVEATRQAVEHCRLIQCDIKTGFGLVCWDELATNGFSNQAITAIANGAATQVFKSIAPNDVSEVEVLADF